MFISEAAAQAGVNVQTIRYYERRGLLPPSARRPSGYRELPDEAVRVVRFIKRAQDLGFSLDEVAELLRLRRSKDRAKAQAVAGRRLKQIEQKLAELSGHARRAEASRPHLPRRRDAGLPDSRGARIRRVRKAHVTMTEGTTAHIDPVCQMTVEPETAAARVRHEGVDYYFCSEWCAEQFKENPSAFLAKPADAAAEAPAPAGTIYFCPMDPEIVRSGPASARSAAWRSSLTTPPSRTRRQISRIPSWWT